MKTGKLIVGLVIIFIGLFILFGNFGLVIWNEVFLQLLFLIVGLLFAVYGIKKDKMLTSGISYGPFFLYLSASVGYGFI